VILPNLQYLLNQVSNVFGQHLILLVHVAATMLFTGVPFFCGYVTLLRALEKGKATLASAMSGEKK